MRWVYRECGIGIGYRLRKKWVYRECGIDIGYWEGGECKENVV